MKKTLIVSFLLISALVAFKDPNVVIAQIVSDDVEICHRTHSVQKPYSRITVSQSSIGTGPGQHGGKSHDEYSEKLFPNGKPYPNVFDREMVYEPDSEKLWGDIIPLKDVNGKALTGEAASVAGLNYAGAGIAIYEGTKGYEELCTPLPKDDSCSEEEENEKSLSSVKTTDGDKDDEEECDVDNSTTTTTTVADSTTTTTTVADSTTTTTTVADLTTTTTTVVDSTTTTSTIVALTTPTTVPSSATTAPTNLPQTPEGSPTSPPTTLSPALGKLKGNVWIDDNRNETPDPEEEPVSQAIIEVVAAKGNPSSKRYSVQPNDAGNYGIENIEPGAWVVAAAILLDGDFDLQPLRKSADAKLRIQKEVFVPVLGLAIADFPVVKTSSKQTVSAQKISELQLNRLPNTGNGSAQTISLVAAFLMLLGLLLTGRRNKTL